MNRYAVAVPMLYLSPDGIVYPCPLVPVALGSISETALRDIAIGEKKRQARASIRLLPVICGECPELPGCHAGCRGRAYVQNGWLMPDPVCGR